MATALMAFLHHVFAFTLSACLVYELIAFHKNMSADEMRRIQRVDLAYGISAGLLLVVGLLRVFLYEKGWAFYMQSPFFWVKMATLLIVGLLSIDPTISFIRWNKSFSQDQTPALTEAEVNRTRLILWLEMAGLAVILLSAAFMARGIGIG